MWPNIAFFSYNYESGHTYRISYDVRVNSVSGLGYAHIRHSAFGNNWEANTDSVNSTTSGWSHRTLERTFTGTTVTQNGTASSIRPIVEFYSAIAPGKTGQFNFDIKNMAVYDVTAGKYVSSTAVSVKNGATVDIGAGDTTLTAHWSANTYKVTYNANGGTGAPATQSFVYNSGAKISTTVPTRTGYTFVDWVYGSVHLKPGDAIPSGWGSFDLIANWSLNNYTYNIKYVSSTGKSLGNDTITSSYSSSKTVTPPAKSGYTAPSSQTVNFDSTSAKTITFTYAPVTYSISYNLNEGSVSGNPTSFNIESSEITLKNPSRTGHNFAGWTGSNGSTAQTTVKIPTGSTGNRSFTANWNVNIYTNSIAHWSFGFKNKEGNNGDKTAFALRTTTFTKKYGEKATYTTADAITPPNGFSLNGRFGSASYEGSWKNYSMGTSFTQPAKSTSVEYDYFPITYNITYNLDSGKIATANPSTYNVLYGVNFSNSPTKNGYTFAGWYIGNTKVTGINVGANATFSSSDDMYAKLKTRTTGNQTVTAKWTVNSYKLTITGDTGVESITGNGTYKYGTTANVTYKIKQGYHIVNTSGTSAEGGTDTWTDRAGKEGTVTDSWNIGTCDRNIKVTTAPNMYTVTYNSNGGSGSMTADTATYNSAYKTQKNSFTRTGYTFTGWNEKADGSGTTWSLGSSSSGTYESGNSWVWVYTNNITLYAQWKANTYTVSYNGNGATGGSTANSSHTYDSAKALAANGYRKTGYTFAGWTTKSDGSGTVYTNGASVKNLTSASGGTVNLYAKWNAKSGTINYIAGNGGTLNRGAETVTGTNKAVGATATPKAGYSFAGWYGDSEEKISSSAALVPGTPTAFNGFGGNYYGGSVAYDATNKWYSVTANAASMNSSWGSGTSFAESDDIPYGKWYIASFEIWSPVDASVILDVNDYARGTSWSGNDNDANRKQSGFGSLTAGTWKKVMFAYQNANAKNTEKIAIYDNSGIGIKYDTAKGNQTFRIRNVQTMIADSYLGSSDRYTAKFSVNNYSISYDLGGGSVTGNPTSYNIESSEITLKNPGKTGYSFAGWTGSNGDTAQTTVKIPTGSTGNKSYTASWKANKYDIVIKGDKGTESITYGGKTYPLTAMNSVTIHADYGTNTTVTYKVKKGFHIVSETGQSMSNTSQTWTNNAGKEGSAGGQTWTTCAFTRTITVNTAANKFVLSFGDGNGGTSGSQNATVGNGEKVTFNATKKPGYTFKNWNTKTDGTGTSYPDGVSIDKIDASNGSTVTLYPIYRPNILTFHFYANGADTYRSTPDEKTHNVTADEKANRSEIALTQNVECMKYDASVQEWGLVNSERLSKTGYTSTNKWHATSVSGVLLDANNGVYAKTQDIAEAAGIRQKLEDGDTDINLYADWSANTYTVKFDANGGAGNPVTQKMTYDKAATLTPVSYMRAKHSFLYWTENADGSGKKYTDKASAENLTATANGTVTLYAQWEKLTDLKIMNTVSGNMGNRAKDFEFSTVFPACFQNKKFTVIKGDGTKETVTIGADGVMKFSLKHGETFTFTDLNTEQVNAIKNLGNRDIIEADYTAEGYRTTYAASTEDDGTLCITYSNTKNSGVPTGNHIGTGIGAAVIIGILGLFFMFRKKFN